jgi:sRNA-binding protein
VINNERFPLRVVAEPAHHELFLRVVPTGPKAKSAAVNLQGTVVGKLDATSITHEEAAKAAIRAKTQREKDERQVGRIRLLDEPLPAAKVLAPGKTKKKIPGSGTQLGKRPASSTLSANGNAPESRVTSPLPGPSTSSTPTSTSTTASAPVKTKTTKVKPDPTLLGRMFRVLYQKGPTKEADILKLLGGGKMDETAKQNALSTLSEVYHHASLTLR